MFCNEKFTYVLQILKYMLTIIRNFVSSIKLLEIVQIIHFGLFQLICYLFKFLITHFLMLTFMCVCVHKHFHESYYCYRLNYLELLFYSI